MRGVKMPRIDRDCQSCGVTFGVLESRLKIGCGVFCSKGCARTAQKHAIPRSCETCGKAFTVSASRTDTRFCSRRCVKGDRKPLAERFWTMVDKRNESECWPWKGSTAAFGYGQIYHPAYDRPRHAHRVSYELHHGTIADGLSVLHSCDNPPCVNPSHLSLGNQLDNSREMIERNRSLRGTKHFMAILTDDVVRACRLAFARGGTINGLAKQFGVSPATMADAIHRRTWVWLE